MLVQPCFFTESCERDLGLPHLKVDLAGYFKEIRLQRNSDIQIYVWSHLALGNTSKLIKVNQFYFMHCTDAMSSKPAIF